MGISNGHAARMRYSRFKSQIDPSTAQKTAKKKNAKKFEKGKHKGDFSMPKDLPTQMRLPWVNSGPALKAEPSEPHYQHNPFMKCEPGNDNVFGDRNLLAGTDAQCDLARMTPDSMVPLAHPPSSRLYQYPSHELPFTMTPGRPETTLIPSSSRFASYPAMHFPQDFSMQDFTMQQPFFSNAPMITWEQSVPYQRELTPAASHHSTPVLVKEEPQDVQQTIEAETPIKTEREELE